MLALKAFRDLGRSRLRTASILVAITLSVGLGIGLVNATEDVKQMYRDRFDSTLYEDMDIQFETANVTSQEVEALEGVGAAVPRLFLQTRTSMGDGERTYKTHWVSAPYHEREPYSRVNGYRMMEGRYVSSPTAAECLVGNLFADEHGLGPGDTLTVRFDDVNVTLEVAGVVSSPEYLYVVDDEGWPQPALLMPLFTTGELTRDVLGLPAGAANQLVIRTEDGHGSAKVMDTVVAYLEGRGVEVTRSILGTEEVDWQFARADVEGMGDMGWLFGLIIMGVASVIIFNSITRLIATQRPYIGVMSALGGRPRKVVAHYCLFGLFLGLLGSAMGIPLGIAFSAGIVNMYADIMNLPTRVYDVYWEYPLQFMLMGTGLSTLAALLGSLRVIWMGPREALSGHYHAQDFSKKPLMERLVSRRKDEGRILTRVPVRNLGRQRVRTLLSMAALAASLVLVFTSTAMVLGFDQPVERNFEEYERWDVRVTLADWHPRFDVDLTLAGMEGDGVRGEPMVDTYVPVSRGGDVEYVHAQAFEEGSSLRSFHVIEGEKDLDSGILAGSVLARDMGLGPGDEIILAPGNGTASVEVTGITGELVDSSLLMSLEMASDVLGTGGMVNSVILDMGDLSREELETLLRENFDVASIAYTEDVLRGMESMLDDMKVMMALFILFGAAAEAMFISTTLVLNILDREGEFISLRAMGIPPGKVRGMITTESLILLAGSLVVGIPLGIWATNRSMDYLVGDLMYFRLDILPEVYILTISVAVVSALLAAALSARHILKMDLTDALRRRE